MNDLILRWAIGSQDTTRLAGFDQEEKNKQLFWLAKLSIASFQKWFPTARCLVFYNGSDIDYFKSCFEQIEIPIQDIEYIDQNSLLKKGELINPYHFAPQGVWYKWVPFRYDLTCHEISIDTDIICISEPTEWYAWLNSPQQLIVAPERFSKILVNTCGDFHSHPLLKNKRPLNCGIVGHKKNYDYSEEFFEITKEIRYGHTHNSLFITEQGAINVWVYSLALKNVDAFVLDFEKCAWIRDFIYYLEKGIKVETVHATTWHKKIAQAFGETFIQRIQDDLPDDEFFARLLEKSTELGFYSRHVLRRQLGTDRKLDEFFA